MNIPELNRDFTFEEWAKLSFEDKRYIWNHYWNGYEPQKGKQTRRAILQAFCETHPNLVTNSTEIGFKYCAHYVACIYLITDASIRVPSDFLGLLINKGKIESQNSDGTLHVHWRHGASDKSFKLLDEKREFFQPAGGPYRENAR